MRIIFKSSSTSAEIAFLITVGKKNNEFTNPRAKEIDIKNAKKNNNNNWGWISYWSLISGSSYCILGHTPLWLKNWRFPARQSLLQVIQGSSGNRRVLTWLLCCVQSLQLCPTLCNPVDCSPSGSFVHGIFQVRILEQAAISYSRGSSRPRDWTHVFCTGRQTLYHWATWEAQWILASSFSS